ncbi:LysR family transcriptional regulator [Pelagibacterium mangrovi]|uniref:LysR family transcriptional regulator n=1 Tax=Pelagibacterium mangrovi TaxID=3119828 RepID=UPI002FC8E9B4
MLNLRQLEVFRAVISSGSFTAAGQQLQMSQPAVTKAIRRMEDQLGFALFLRDRGRIAPTPEASSLFAEVDKVFHTIGIVEKYAHDLKEAQSGVLTLASTPTMSCGFLTEAIARFRQERSRVRVWLQTTTTKETLALAATNQVDLGLIYAPAEESAVHSIPLFDAEVVCVVRRDNPLVSQKSIAPLDLVGHSVITNVRNQPLHDLVDRAFGEEGLNRQVMIGTNNTVTACALVRSGGGVAIVEPMGVAELFPELVLLPISPSIVLTPRIVHSRTVRPSRVARRFLRTLNEVLGIPQDDCGLH